MAHPDLINFTGDGSIYRKHVRRLCKEAKNCGIPLEINLSGIETGRNFPNRLFWEEAAEENCDCIIGCDAHTPHAVVRLEAEKEALKLVHNLGLNLMDTVKLRSIG